MEQENQQKQTPQTPQEGQPSSSGTRPSEQVSGMAIICYIGFLCLVPYLAQEKDETIRFHAKQGLILFFLEIATWAFITPLPFFALTLSPLLHLCWLVLSGLGIYNVIKGRQNKLSLIGGLADKIKF